MSASLFRSVVPRDGKFERQYCDYAKRTPGAVARLRARIRLFCRQGERYSPALRTGPRRRSRHLVPPIEALGASDDLIAVVDVDHGQRTATLLRLHELGPMTPAVVLEREIAAAEADYSI